MNIGKIIALAAVAPNLLGGIELQPATLKAWNEYIQAADAGAQARQPYLWADESAGRKARLLRGEIIVAPVGGNGRHGVPNGLIHDWIGAAFIPNATIAGLFQVVHDYTRYKDFFGPVVAESRAISCTDTNQEFSMVWQHRILFVNAAMQGRYRARDVMVNAHRGYNIADAAEVREIEEYGHPAQRLLPPDTGNGFIWRMHSIARYEERDGGLYLEIQAIAMTRDIPASLRMLVSPVVTHLSVNSLTTTLRQTRDAVVSAPVISAKVLPR